MTIDPRLMPDKPPDTPGWGPHGPGGGPHGGGTIALVSALRAYLLTLPAVTSWVDTRIYALEFPQSLTAPAIRLHEIDRVGTLHLRGNLLLHRSRVQVDCVEAPSHGDPYANAHALALAVHGDMRGGSASGLAGFRGTLSGLPIQSISEADQREVFDSATSLIRIEQDYIVSWEI